MVALDAPRSALATLDPCQLLGLSVKLLDLPLTPRTSRASCAESRERSYVTIHSVRQECTTTRKSFTLQFLGKPLIFMSLPFLSSSSLQSNSSTRRCSALLNISST